tara:strand:- start:461 stop:589 length:129 start_codon:yes stop_codon:yes gene_type:complete
MLLMSKRKKQSIIQPKVWKGKLVEQHKILKSYRPVITAQLIG